ncbi:MAG: response regulator [Polyangiales bacterium]
MTALSKSSRARAVGNFSHGLKNPRLVPNALLSLWRGAHSRRLESRRREQRMAAQQVLLIEDNPIVRSMIASTLRECGVVVIEVSNCGEAIAQLQRAVVDLVLTELALPDTSGVQLVQRLREHAPEGVPVVAVVGLLTPRDAETVAEAGFDDVLSKPIEPAALRSMLRTYLSSDTDRARFGTNRRVLIVDDDPMQRKLLSFRLSRLGFETTSAESGIEALGAISTLLPDVIISDVLMPQLDGFELCEKIRSNPTHAAAVVVLVTNSYLEDSDRDLARRVGADAYLSREPDFHTLIATLRTCVAQLPRTRRSRPALVPEDQGERASRAARQLDRQIQINSSLSQRAAMLSAEISVLESLAHALTHQGDADSAIEATLRACFDAGNIEWGVLLTREDDRWSQRNVTLREERMRGSLSTITPDFALRADTRAPYVDSARTLFGLDVDRPVTIAPVMHHEQVLGALVLGTEDYPLNDQLAFAGAVAGQLALMLELSRTFSQLRSATDAERERVQMLESTLNTIRHPIVVVDVQRRPVRWNAAASDAFDHVTDLIVPPVDKKRAMFFSDMSTRVSEGEHPATLALAGEQVDDFEVYLQQRDREPKWLSITARPVLGDDAKVTGAVVMARDITAEKSTYERTITADRLATVGVLAAGVAHEINNPLTSMIAELEMAMEDIPSSSPGYARLVAAREAALRVRTISHELKTLSRGDTDDLEPVSLNHVVQVAVRLTAHETRSSAQVTCEFGELPPVCANETRIVQVIVNLLVNAAHAIGRGAAANNWIRIVTRAADNDDEVVLEVSDTGCGMSADVKARIFTPFFTTKPVGTGTGLGLSISHRIVTDAGGRIECDSILGQGTTFRVVLRRFHDAALRRSLRGIRLKQRAIILIESDPLSRQLAQRALSESYEVQALLSVDEATRAIDRAPPVLVLCSSSDAQHAGQRAVELLASRSLSFAILGAPSELWLERWPAARKPLDPAQLKQFVAKILVTTDPGGVL